MIANVDGYTILKMFHVVFAILWVGGAITVNILGTRAVASGNGERVALFGRDTEWLGTRIFFPSSVLVLLFGILTVLRGHIGFGHAWVIVGLVGIGLTAITGSAFLGRRRSGSPSSPSAGAPPTPSSSAGCAGWCGCPGSTCWSCCWSSPTW